MKWNTEIDLDKHNIWFTSDLHLYHANILWMNKRPFENCDEMYEYIVNDWNSKVKDDDYVFVLGDVLWGSQATRLQNFANKVKGHICIILGNHDKEKTANGVSGSNFDCFYSFDRADFIRVKSASRNIDTNIYMCHYPALSWPSKSRGSLHLHGHVHGNMDELNEASPDLRVDVGIDAKLGHMKLLSFDDIYTYFLNKTGGKSFFDYMKELYNNDNNEIIK